LTEAALVHGTAVAIGGRGLLLRGPPGAGKSDLAVRLVDGGARLVADDQVELRRAGTQILVSAPAAIAGLIEVRGIGIIRLHALTEVPLALVADLAPPAKVERLPDCHFEDVLGLRIPLIAIAAFEASAAAKLRLALNAFPVERLPAILPR
jgi:HPr kinase/phosphorylase